MRFGLIIDHGRADYAAIARHAGVHAVRVEQLADVEGALRSVLEHDGPALLDVVTDPNGLEIPPHLTRGKGEGVRAQPKSRCHGRRCRNVLDLARANLRDIPHRQTLLAHRDNSAAVAETDLTKREEARRDGQ